MTRFNLKNLGQPFTGTRRRRLALAMIPALAALCAIVGFNPSAQAEPGRHIVEVRRGYPPGYRHILVARERFYRSIPVVRFYGPRYLGFGFFYTDAAAFAFLGLTAWQLHVYEDLNEAQLRAHEAAIAEATTAPINDEIVWNDDGASGSVTPIRDGHTPDGRECREFQQRVTIGGKDEQGYGTACLQPDGAWKIAETPTH